MKEKFSLAIQKMKRKDFLDDVIREKTAEISELSSEAVTLRKKNGVRTGTELDLKIYQINAKKATIEKLIAKCKAEIKILKGEIADLLVECYVLAEKPEHKAKVEAAVYHAFEGKQKLVNDKDAGGIWGDCDIIGAIVTHDKKKKKTTAKLVSAGIVDCSGAYIRRPKIYVYDYDKKQEEGIFHPETNEYKTRVKPGKDHKVLDYIKDVYFNANLIVLAVIIALYAGFSIWATASGFAVRCFSPFYYTMPTTLAIAFGLYTLATLKTGEKGGLSDMLPLGAILTSLVAFGCSFGYPSVIRASVFPIAMLVYGVVAIFLRVKKGGYGEGSQNFDLALTVFLGVVLGMIFRRISLAPRAYWLTALVIFGVIFFVGGCFSVARPSEKIGKIGKWYRF